MPVLRDRVRPRLLDVVGRSRRSAARPLRPLRRRRLGRVRRSRSQDRVRLRDEQDDAEPVRRPTHAGLIKASYDAVGARPRTSGRRGCGHTHRCCRVDARRRGRRCRRRRSPTRTTARCVAWWPQRQPDLDHRGDVAGRVDARQRRDRCGDGRRSGSARGRPKSPRRFRAQSVSGDVRPPRRRARHHSTAHRSTVDEPSPTTIEQLNDSDQAPARRFEPVAQLTRCLGGVAPAVACRSRSRQEFTGPALYMPCPGGGPSVGVDSCPRTTSRMSPRSPSRPARGHHGERPGRPDLRP